MGLLTDEEVRRYRNRDLVIVPWDEAQCLTSLGYDLSIGWILPLNALQAKAKVKGERKAAPETPDSQGLFTNPDSVILSPRESAFIIASEFVWLSPRLAGTLHSRGSLAARGLFLNSTTVDPNWKGQMVFLAFNSTDQPLELKIGERFITMVLHRLAFPTSSTHRGKPEDVLQRLLASRGIAWDRSHSAYLQSSENESKRREFEQLVDHAKRPTIAKLLADSTTKMIATTRQGGLAKMARPFTALVLLISLLGLITVPFAWPMWGLIQKMFHVNVPYSPTITVGQVVVWWTFLLTLKSFNRPN